MECRRAMYVGMLCMSARCVSNVSFVCMRVRYARTCMVCYVCI